MYTDYTEENNNEIYYDNQVKNNNNGKEKLKKIVIFVLVFVISLILIILLAKGCQKDKNEVVQNENLVPSISINRQSLSLEVGDEFELVADILNTKNENPIVTWYSEDSEVVSINDKGYVTAISEGTTNVVAMYRENGKLYSSKCEIIVSEEVIELESIDIVQDDITIQKGKGILLEVSPKPTGAKLGKLVFTSDDSKIATVSESGYVNAISAGITTITVKTENSKLSDKVTIRVKENTITVVNPVSLQLKPLANNLTVGATAKISYTLLPSTATDKTLTWTSSNKKVATVDKDGVVKAVGVGTCKIIASTINNISSSIDVTVQAKNVAVTGIVINGGNSITMQVGGTKLISYTISPSTATNKNVTYSTNNTSVVLVDSNGLITAVRSGNAVVTVKTNDGKKTANISIKVIDEASSSGSSSGGNSSGGTSSGGNSSGGSSSGSSSSSESSNVSCSSSLMTYITHNSKGSAIVSSISFSKATPFKISTTPTITFLEIADCLNLDAVYYNIYYGETESKVSTTSYRTGPVRVNSTISLDKGNGYYKIRVYGTKAGTSTRLTKYYYAIVQNPTPSTNTTPTLKLDVVDYKAGQSDAGIKFTATANAGVKEIWYCAALNDTCIPTSKSKITANGNTSFTITKGFVGIQSETRICAWTIDKNNAKSGRVCTLSNAFK